MSNETDEKIDGEGDAQAPAAPVSIEERINQLEADKQALEAEKKDLHERLLRTAADFENWKKRIKKEVDESSQKGRETLIKDLLPVVDNLERALKHAAADDPLAQGVRMVEKQMVTTLEKGGVTRFSALGKPFDPTVHEAVQQVETSEMPPGMVAQEFSQGYLSGTRLLRPAMVAVSKLPAASEPAPTDGATT